VIDDVIELGIDLLIGYIVCMYVQVRMTVIRMIQQRPVMRISSCLSVYLMMTLYMYSSQFINLMWVFLLYFCLWTYQTPSVFEMIYRKNNISPEFPAQMSLI